MVAHRVTLYEKYAQTSFFVIYFCLFYAIYIIIIYNFYIIKRMKTTTMFPYNCMCPEHESAQIYKLKLS